MSFGNWPDELHYEISQLKRINSGLQIKSKNIKSINRDNKTAIIIGSDGDEYNVTLTSCTCFDFNGQRPCKHIYRLAAECNMLPPLPTINPDKAKMFENKVPDIIEEYKKLYFDGALTADKFFKIVNALNTKMKYDVEPKTVTSNKKDSSATLYTKLKALVDSLPSSAQLLLLSMLTEVYLEPTGECSKQMLSLLLEKELLSTFSQSAPSEYEIISRFTVKQLNKILNSPIPYTTRGLLQERFSSDPKLFQILLQNYNAISPDSHSEYVNYYWPEKYAAKRYNIINYLEKKLYTIEDAKNINLPNNLMDKFLNK